MNTPAELAAMKADGNCWIENTDTRETFWWPFCIVDGCINRACLRLSSPRCYPHTLPGVPRPGDEVEVTAESEEVGTASNEGLCA